MVPWASITAAALGVAFLHGAAAGTPPVDILSHPDGIDNDLTTAAHLGAAHHGMMGGFLAYHHHLSASPPLSCDEDWAIANQRVEYMQSPALGIDVAAPRFGWVIDGSKIPHSDVIRGVRQDSFQLVVKEVDSGSTVWDSGRVQSEENRHVAYGSVGKKPGKALKSATAYDWTVTVWLRQSKTAVTNVTTTTPARFVTSFLDSNDWNDADWLTGAGRNDSLCRHEFSVQGSPKRAILLVAGLGYFQATLNGEQVSDAVLESGWTDYAKRVLYSTYDVTHLLLANSKQQNVLGISLGNGWYATDGGKEPEDAVPRVFRAKLVVDGQTAVATTASAWSCHAGPIVYDSIYNGEIYDARVEPEVDGWDKAGFDGSQWAKSVPVKGPAGKLVSPKMPCARRIMEMKPKSLSMPQPGVYVFDFGQNFAGRVAITIPANQVRKGNNVTIRHAEVLQHMGIVGTPEPGMIYTENLRSARATDIYIFGGQSLRPSERSSKDVVYEPSFTYHGFRYVEITGMEPTLDSVTAYLIHTDVPGIGSIEFSDGLLNSIQSAIHWGQRSNILSVPTDCPQRDERKGWLGDAQLSGEESQYNFDMVATHLKFLNDIVDEQNEKGELTDTAPLTFGSQPADPSWGSAFPSLVYYLWRETGDKQIISDYYAPLSLYMDSLLTSVQFSGIGQMLQHYGDWCWVPGTPRCSSHLTASFSMIENLQQMHDMATALGSDTDAVVWMSYIKNLKRAFHDAFYVNGTYDAGVQTCLALPLWINSPPDKGVTLGLSHALLTDLIDRQDFHFTTGIIGLKYILEVLSFLGREDVAVTTLQQKTYPSFGYMLTNEYEPATTIWELWNAHLQGPGMNSRNHIMFGGPVGGFFYKFLGGIKALHDNTTAGYREFLVTPPLNPCMALESTKTTFLSPHGLIRHEWHHVSGGIQVHVEVPVGSTAHVVFDGKAMATKIAVSLSGTDVHKLSDLKVVDTENGMVVTIFSGAWDFEATYDFNAADNCRNASVFVPNPVATSVAVTAVSV